MDVVLGIPKTLSIGIPYAYRPIIVGMATTIGERIRAAREELQRSRGEKTNLSAFARELKISAASLHQLESGKSGAPSADTLLKMRDRGLSQDYIMNGRGPRLQSEYVQWHKETRKLMGKINELDDDARKAVVDVVDTLIRRRA